MPWAIKTKPRKGHAAIGQADSKDWNGPKGYPTLSGCFSIFFMPTYLSRHFSQEKRISILKLCLCYVRLPAKNEKFSLGICFQTGRCGSLGTLAVERVPEPFLFQLRCIGLGRKHLRMTK